MARVFTITEGLENMGALKTGGQGSVYKGRRIGEIITAIKLLPTPISSESAEDKNYTSFLNEVEKLKKVNEEPNPHVVKILSSGITDSGNFPYIEMEYIEGPDLEELLQPPHNPVFTIKEVLKVADQLSFALAHCHKLEVRHGDIKSNNVKYNTATGNYVLLDFGLAVMSDEQRRTSLRQAGAIEFMAPEQSEGQMLFQTDVYSFGVVLFELLAGVVPFPLKDKGESARNNVVLAHLEMPPPDLLSLRSQNIPSTWGEDKRLKELQVPEWLISMVYKCIEKKPENRFPSGVELNEYISQNTTRSAADEPLFQDERIIFLEEENKRLRDERDHLQQQWLSSKQPGNPNLINSRHASIPNPVNKGETVSKKGTVRKLMPWIALLILVIIAGFIISRSGSTNINNSVANTSLPAGKKARKPGTEAEMQLQNARQLLNENKIAEALVIYNALVKENIPEAMYQYGKLGLQNQNKNISCAEAFDLLVKAANEGYTLAKRTLGLLYSYADDQPTLQQSYYFERCVYRKDVPAGSKLLMEATLEGDTIAARLLDELHKRK
jgi:serine/threonine protein kinase